MKRLFFILFFSPFLFAFTEDPVMPNFSPIATAISTGNAEALSKYFDADVEISLFEKEDSYEKEKAANLMKDFFAKNKPKGFSQMHQGASKGKDTQYTIGEISTASGNYRVYIYMKVVSDNYLIQEIRIGKN
jgi:hypothetical protein